jgi:hypothetical protein
MEGWSICGANDIGHCGKRRGGLQARRKVGEWGRAFSGSRNKQEAMRVTFEALKKDSASIEELLSGSPLGEGWTPKKTRSSRSGSTFSRCRIQRDFEILRIAVWSGAVNTDELNSDGSRRNRRR